MEDQALTCPRCGDPIPPPEGRGRRRKWCSDKCRRIAFETRRAAETGARPVEIREQTRVVYRSRPLSPDGAVDRVLSDTQAIDRLLRVLAHRVKNVTPSTEEPYDLWRWQHNYLYALLHRLWRAHFEAEGKEPGPPPEPPPPPRPAPPVDAGARREAVELVLSSPRSVREVLVNLARQARAGELDRPEYGGAVDAVEDLVRALRETGSIQP